MTIESETPKPVTAYCRSCGKPLTEETVRMAQGTVYCEEHLPRPAQPQAAGSPYAASAAPSSGLPNPGVSPGLAFLLGLIPGVGAIYNGQYAKGLVHVLILGMLISINSSDGVGELGPLFGLLTAVFWFYMAFEAYHTARKRQAGEIVDEFSSLVQIKGEGGGFPVLPVALISLGVVFLLNNLGVLRLRYIIQYWPVLLILAGGWMLYNRLTGGPAARVEPPAAPEVPHE
ncbi:MAG: hypothetical protein IPP47_21020 [Bryobacterales bacterium]|nr:hypothetical protein [Bryobacterales bacterium]